MFLYHYFNKEQGPFLSVTEMPFNLAKAFQENKQKENPKSVNPNIDWFLKTRYEMESKIREMFISIGGEPIRKAPFYMTLGEHPQLMTWYDNPEYLKIPMEEFDIKMVSFTYGDSFPVFNKSLNDGREFWEKVYFYYDIVKIIDKYGYPEYIEYDMGKWIFPSDKPINQHLKYIEAHIWSDDVIKKYRTKWMNENRT